MTTSNTTTADQRVSAINGSDEDWRPLRILVVALCFILNMLDGADLLIMSFVAPVLSTEWNISAERLGVLFSASLAGMAVGCLFVAPLSDRFGRRKLMVAALSLVTVSMLASGFVTSVMQLMVLRLLVGVGVGTVGVTMTAMAAEYAPSKHSSFAAGLVQAGWPMGSVITAFAAARLIETAGWRPLFIGIAAGSFGLLLAIFVFLPESLSFLLRRKPQSPAIGHIAARLGVTDIGQFAKAANVAAPPAKLRDLFTGQGLMTTIYLWTAVAFGYFVLYFVISWIPTLVAQAGLPVDKAIFAGATYNFGAFLGTAFMGWLAIRFRVKGVVLTLFVCAAAMLVIFGGVKMPVLPTLLAAALVGITVQGGFNGFWALAAKIYPPEVRATGIGWALGVGRIGAVLGPIVGGVLIGAGASMALTFVFYAAIALVAALLVSRVTEPRLDKAD